MRLLMTTDTVGGVWTFTCTLTEELLRRGHEVCLVSFGRLPSPAQQQWGQDVVCEKGQLTTLFTGIPLEWMQNNEHAFEQGAEELLDDAACFRPDLILSNQFCFGQLDTAILRIVVAHSDVLSWAQACKPGTLAPSPWLTRYMHMVQTGLHAAAAVVAPTAWMGQTLSANFSLPQGFTTIPNGVRIEPAPAPQRQWQAITAGRFWDEAKGLDTLAGLETSAPLLVAGENTFESPDPQTSWPGNLTSLGPLSQPALHRYFRESNLYLCASRYEPFGLAPVEAALCGCAVLCRDIPSLREVWADAALYFTDQPSLAHLMRQLGCDYPLLRAASQRSYERAQLYTPQRMADGYLALFDRVLQHPEAHAA